MDFNIDYTLPYFNEIYDEIKSNFPYLFYNLRPVKYPCKYPCTIFEKYLEFVQYVRYVVSYDMKFHDWIDYRKRPIIPRFEMLDSVLRWMENTPNNEYKIPTMKLMLIMKYFEDMDLSRQVSSYCKRYGRQAFTKFDSQQQIIPDMYFNTDTKRFEFTIWQRFEMLSGYSIDNDIAFVSDSLKLSNQKYYQHPSLIYKLKSIFKSEPNIPYILYNTICRNLYYDYCMYGIYNKFYHSDLYDYYYARPIHDNVKSCMKCLYGPVKLCYIYAKYDKDYSCKDPYYDFVYNYLLTTFERYHVYPYNQQNIFSRPPHDMHNFDGWLIYINP